MSEAGVGVVSEVAEGIELPQYATCYCPMKGAEVFMKRCEPCEYSRGLVVFNPKAVSFSERYRLVCVAPIPRKITVIEE